MTKKRFGTYFLCILATAILLISCAKTGTLSGGEKDTEIPKVLKEKSFSTHTTNYAGEDIELYFNEYIQLNNPSKTLSVSPPTDYAPTITTRGKKMTIKWHRKEKLKENMTYRIVMNGTVGDFTENNKIEEQVYVFSTGEEIDTLQLSGNLAYVDKENNPRLISLYTTRAPEDSLIVNQKPLYYTWTEEDGTFSFENIKEGVYYAYSIHDKNLNLKYDPATEEVGFLDTLIRLDTITKGIAWSEMPLDIEQSVEKSSSTTYGYADIDMLLPIDTSCRIEVLDTVDMPYTIYDKNIRLWYRDSINRVRVNVCEDTLNLKLANKDTSMISSDRMKLVRSAEYFVQEEGWKLAFSAPIDSIYIDSFYLGDSTRLSPNIKLDIDVNRLIIQGIDTGSVALTLKSGALINHLGSRNDSIRIEAQSIPRDSLLMPRVAIVGLDSIQEYIVRIKMGPEEIYKHKIGISDIQDTTTLNIPNVLPSTYTMEIVEDTNGDGRWTNGSYFTSTQAERRHLEELEISALNTERIVNFGARIVNNDKAKEEKE